MRLVLLAALTGCYSPGYRDCEISCPTGACPSGLRCEAGACRAEGASGPCTVGDGGIDGIDGPPDDVDSDGVLNADDNCPNKYNPDQANEDGDSYGDVCDPCPPFGAPTDNADGDTDGVGDSCDPNPTMPGDRITVFAGFKTDLSSGMAVPNSAWLATGGEAVVNGTASSQSVLGWPTDSMGSQAVLARFTISSLNGTLPYGIGVVMRWDITATNGVVCWFNQNPGEMTAYLRLTHLGGTDLNATGAQVTIGTGVGALIDLTRRQTSYTCSESSTSQRAMGNSTFDPAMPYTGVTSVGVGGKFQWVMIVSGP